jgi:hypothetical protein
MACLCSDEHCYRCCSHPQRPEDSFEKDVQSNHGHLAKLGKSSKIPVASPVLIADLQHLECNFYSHQVLLSLTQLHFHHSTKDTPTLHQKSSCQSAMLDLIGQSE